MKHKVSSTPSALAHEIGRYEGYVRRFQGRLAGALWHRTAKTHQSRSAGCARWPIAYRNRRSVG